ncbi:hypothetical protein AVEN_132253-1 [Araneus ventricosus]|uniref:TGF-beta family profile domain-containing protein n=1 Tax=Araneus ventricosus TaxID=182803 RepID=A0A4Y2S7R9_ARAVE|nr:hypothetical protein AVEN_132253-1 [Araneus ventricosus]
MDKEPEYSVSTRLTMDEYEVKRVEFHLEIYGHPRKKAEKLENREFVANILTSGNRVSDFNVSSSPIFLNENSLELTFDISTVYNAAKEDCLVDIDFIVRIQRMNGRTAKSLMRKNVKAYVLVYESIESCELLDFFHSEKRFRRSPSVHRSVPKMNLKSSQSIESCEFLDFFHSEERFRRSPSVHRSVPKVNLKSLPILAESKLCKVNEFPISFQDIGFEWIIFPEIQDIGICSGFCSINFADTGYRLLQTVSYSKTGSGQPVACHPTELGGFPIIYSDFSDKMPVIAQFSGMRVKQCGCR